MYNLRITVDLEKGNFLLLQELAVLIVELQVEYEEPLTPIRRCDRRQRFEQLIPLNSLRAEAVSLAVGNSDFQLVRRIIGSLIICQIQLNRIAARQYSSAAD